MQKYLDLLDTNLIFIKSERIDDTFKIYCESKTTDDSNEFEKKYKTLETRHEKLKTKLEELLSERFKKNH